VFILLPKKRSYCGLARSIDQLDSPGSCITFISVFFLLLFFISVILGLTLELEWTRRLFIYVTKLRGFHERLEMTA
jgi:sterol desaturase/sphingolipid hydroxylase (fatty acid hydroxylase superfamily)